jgi:hypothetical protein
MALPVVGLTDARRVRVADRFITWPTPASPPRHVRVRSALENGLVRSDRQRVNISFERYLFAICGRHEIRCQWGVVGPFPHRNGIVAKSPFGIDVRRNDRAMEGVPVFP